MTDCRVEIMRIDKENQRVVRTTTKLTLKENNL